MTTTSEAPAERTRDEVFADAVRVMTEAARLTRPVLGKDEAASEAAGKPVWAPTGEREQADWAEFVAEVCCAVAANVGSTSRALAGRPGSWEADSVRQLICGTVGWDEDYLAEHRTEPLVFTLYVDEILADRDVWASYDDANTELDGRYDALGIPTLTGSFQSQAEWEAAVAELPPVTGEQERQVEAIEDLRDRLVRQQEQDWAAYGEALKANVEAAAAAVQGLRVPVVVHIDLETYRPVERDDAMWFGLPEQILEKALQATPLPGGGRAPLERLQQPE